MAGLTYNGYTYTGGTGSSTSPVQLDPVTVTASNPNKSGSSFWDSNFWSSLPGLGMSVAGIIQATKPVEQPQTQPWYNPFPQQGVSGNNTLLWVGGGLVLVLVLFFAFRK